MQRGGITSAGEESAVHSARGGGPVPGNFYGRGGRAGKKGLRERRTGPSPARERNPDDLSRSGGTAGRLPRLWWKKSAEDWKTKIRDQPAVSGADLSTDSWNW